MDAINNRRPLKEFGSVFTYQKYMLAVEGNNDLKRRRKIVFNKKYSEQDEYCFVQRDVEESNLCYVNDRDDDSIYYIHLLLDSTIGRLMLNPPAVSNVIKGQVTLKSLKDFPVEVVSQEIMRAAASLDLTIRTIIQLLSEKEDAQFLESARNLMHELRDDFVLELYAKPLFESNNIEIVSSLVEIRNNCPADTLESIVPHFLKGITDPNSALLSNMRRVRVLISSIKDTLDSNS